MARNYLFPLFSNYFLVIKPQTRPSMACQKMKFLWNYFNPIVAIDADIPLPSLLEAANGAEPRSKKPRNSSINTIYFQEFKAKIKYSKVRRMGQNIVSYRENMLKRLHNFKTSTMQAHLGRWFPIRGMGDTPVLRPTTLCSWTEIQKRKGKKGNLSRIRGGKAYNYDEIPPT